MRILLAIATLMITLIGAVIYFNTQKWEKLPVDAAQKVLETPYHFLLKLPEHREVQLTHASDIFSTWGQLVFTADHHSTRTIILERLKKDAQKAGWQLVDQLNDVETPDLSRFGIAARAEDLALQQSSALPHQNPPTRYGCRIWISEDGNLIIASWRVDGE